MKYIVKKIEGDEYLCPWTRQTKQKKKKKKKRKKTQHNMCCTPQNKNTIQIR